ncbi:methyltransferase domain-containing protein [Methyloversatilis sp. MC4-4]|uniref:class I SAM-dependent methyltransferase n=1 Tax=Methyloversatilis sp. MC4-4 TaxID=3132824 RepID=UPI003CFB6849
MALNSKYDEFYGDHASEQSFQEVNFSGWPKDRVQAIVAMNLSGERILDIGCGDGYLLYQFRQSFRELLGLEYSPVRLESARQKLREFAFRPICGSAEKMDELQNDSIDCIVTADVIEHIPDVYEASSEMYRVLKPGGVLVINTPNIAFAVKRLRLLAGRFPSTSQPNEGLGSDVLFDGGHLHYFTFRSLSLLLKRNGFVVEKKIGFGPCGKVHDFWPELMSVGVQLIVRKPH